MHKTLSMRNDIDNVIYSRCVSIEIYTDPDFRHIDDLFHGGGWIFRGQSDANWNLQTSLERCLGEKGADACCFSRRDEICAIREFMNRAGGLLREWLTDERHINIGCLAIMQHYGVPTRLLDFTTNIRKAMFFSCAYDNAIDHAIWAIRLNALYDDKRILSNDYTASLTTQPLKSYEGFALCPTPYMGMPREPPDEHLLNRAETNIRSIELEYEGRILPGVQPLYVRQNNPRQIEQEGLFLMPNTFGPFVDELAASLDIDSMEVVAPPEIGSLQLYENLEGRWNSVVLVKMVLKPSFADVAKAVWERTQMSIESMYPDITDSDLSDLANQIREKIISDICKRKETRQ